ncbi:DUF6177 family protein [Amnibacterium setariae]|uniref:Uncharacterized protein n=1 Tax=Amnibacterium setariae TaxID=2306585 RepID=A0A3A1TXF9_9MICO|nr:DUF6177 family protein [Amnibacterium setariae]RIX28460.1 hypothetical protein D1781_13620 [Amnibacterium setariae]
MTTGEARPHPLVDGIDGDEIVSRSDREVVALTPLRADLLVAAHAARRRVRLVTPATSRLTDPLRDALVSAGGSWVVEDGAGAAWDGLLGLATDGTGVAPSFLRPVEAEALQLVVTASLRHRAEAATRIGAALELVAGLGRGGPTGWGPHEPVEFPWDPAAVTRHLAARAPEESRVVVAGSSMIGSTLVQRTDKGVEEVLQALVALGPVGASSTDAALEQVPARLRMLAEDALPLFASVFARPGRADLTTAPHLQAPPVPVAVLIGAPGVRDLALDVPQLVDRFGALVVGRPRIPGVVVPFGGADGGWAALERFIDVVGRERVRAVLRGMPAPGRTEV